MNLELVENITNKLQEPVKTAKETTEESVHTFLLYVNNNVARFRQGFTAIFPRKMTARFEQNYAQK